MAGLTTADIRRLETDAAQPGMTDAKPYLAEAMESLRQTGDPVDTLTLLLAFWGTGYASRPGQKPALDAVGSWLERRLQREPGIPVERLRLELGWLRRMVLVQNERRRTATSNQGSRRAGAPSPAVPARPRFGLKLDELRRQRTRALQTARAVQAPAAPAPSAKRTEPPPPTELPDLVEVTFADIADMRQTRKRARERSKAKKPPKDRLLAVRAVDGALARLAANLACSLLDTAGLDAVFAEMDRRSGVSPTFYVHRSHLVERDGKRIAQRISLAPEIPPHP